MKYWKTMLLILACLLLFNISLSMAEDSKYEFKFGAEGLIGGILIDDFETAEINDEKTWHTGTVENVDGAIHLESRDLADAYGVGIPKANIEKKYQQALYLGFRVINHSDGDVYFNIQGLTNSGDYFMSAELEKTYYLIDDEGFSHEIIFLDSIGNFGRYSLILPEEFSGYILVPTDAITLASDWLTPIWNDQIELETVGMHATTYGSPAVYASHIHVEVDDFFIVNDPIPTYVEPTPEPTPEPTDTPKVTSTPEVTPTSVIKNDGGKKGVNPLVIALPIFALLTIFIIIVIIYKKKIA